MIGLEGGAGRGSMRGPIPPGPARFLGCLQSFPMPEKRKRKRKRERWREKSEGREEEGKKEKAKE